MARRAKLHINRHNGDEEKLVNGCGGHQDSDHTYEALIGSWERTCFFCSRGMCVPCRGEGRQGESQTEGEAGERTGSVHRGVSVHMPCSCMLTALLFNIYTMQSISSQYKVYHNM